VNEPPSGGFFVGGAVRTAAQHVLLARSP